MEGKLVLQLFELDIGLFKNILHGRKRSLHCEPSRSGRIHSCQQIRKEHGHVYSTLFSKRLVYLGGYLRSVIIRTAIAKNVLVIEKYDFNAGSEFYLFFFY